MINSVNTLEFLKPKLLSMEKLNTTNSTTRTHHQLFASTAASRTFYNIVNGGVDHHQHHHQVAEEQPKQQERVKVQLLENHKKLQNNDCWNNICNLLNTAKNKIVDVDTDGDTQNHQEQPMEEMHNESGKTDAELETTKSAFNLDLNIRKIYSNNNNNNNSSSYNSKSSPPMETNNNELFYKQNGFINKQPQQQQLPHQQQQQKTMMVLLPRRTEDQEHAHRRIEIVHNYAKLKSYEDDTSDSQSPNGSRNSSYLDDEEDDGDDDNEEDDYGEDDDMNDADYDAEEDEMIDLDGVYEDIIKRRKYPKLQKQTSMDVDGAFSRMVEKQTKPNATTTTSTTYNNINKRCPNLTIPQTKHHTITRKEHSDEDGDIHVDVDVETIDNLNLLNPTIATATITNCGISRGGDSVVNKPDHHARRPMNAFLIFCKRHRAIVKERYKNLENRAITKILGDWWASLDASDKECFTNLAQQNKDAFFSANPNFKWYKLPAPPLRTLNIRPNQIAEGGGNGDIMENGDGCGNYHHHHMTTVNPNSTAIAMDNNNAAHSNRNYFKLADEAQMGDLSQLMQNKSGPQQCALQQALGETSQFIRSHITGNVDDTELVETKSLKRPLYNENSFSSNSSEDDTLIPKKKISRSCKGKIYQELINSGQIAAPAIKKSKSMQRFTTELSSQQSNMCCSSDTPIMMGGHRYANEVNNQSIVNANNNNNNASMQMDRRNNFDLNSEATNTSSPDMVSFDLEEKIKELPALSLDEYLQRKRNTKKKKKFTTSGKKRSKCGNNTASGGQGTNGNKNQQPHYGTLEARIIQQRKQQQQAVGSQKRKARKESITRRDVSAIEEEVASLLPVTINGSCYYQEATTLPLSAITSSYKSNTKDMNSPSSPNSSKPTSPIIPLISTTATIMTTAAVTAVTPTSQRALSTPGGETEMSKESLTNNTNTLNDNISSTSDLLILAEVAANRTEKED